jgi:hypothetical protein
MSWGGYIPGGLGESLPPIMEDTVADEKPFQALPPRGNLLWAAVDLDGTLAEGVWTPDNPTTDIGPVKVYPSGKTARDLCLELVEAGYKIVVHTSRGYTDLENIERWLEHHKIPYRQVVCGKLLAAVYIDDRNRDIFEESWVPEGRS